jgi:hypothetical protein
MRNLNEYRKRFQTLMESTIGDVKPLISEQNFKDKLIKQGYKDITSWFLSDVGVVYIPDGKYVGKGTQDYVHIKTPQGIDTGYVLFWEEPMESTRGGGIEILIESSVDNQGNIILKGAVIRVAGKFNSLMLNETKLNSSGLKTN